MTVTLASWLAIGCAAYLVAGAVFAAWSHARGLDPGDTDVANGSWGFRAVVTPGLVALWPLFLRRGLGEADPRTAHDPRPRPHVKRLQPILALAATLLALAVLVLAAVLRPDHLPGG